jgi:hypothetical protein
MRLKDLLEGPELRAWEQNQEEAAKYHHDHLSFQTIEDLYMSIGQIGVLQHDVYGFLNKKHYNCIGAIRDVNPRTHEECMRVISHVSFYEQTPSHLPTDIVNPLQVQQAWTHPDFVRYGIATFLYATLVRSGFTVISDRIQYLGGQQLWKSMAKKAGLGDYVVVVYNVETGYAKDQNGQVLMYDGSNIDDSIIWDQSTLGRDTVMMMKAK